MKHNKPSVIYGPETTSPLLPPDGYPVRTPTRHVFDHYEDIPIEDLTYAGPVGLRHGRALIYRCLETGKMRRWGIE